jgi:hypothetical protein
MFNARAPCCNFDQRGGRRPRAQHVESTVNPFRLLQGEAVAVAGPDEIPHDRCTVSVEGRW